MRSSGNLLADRRFGFAEALAAEGEQAAAADLLEQTLELVPDWAPAWLALGLARERAGRSDAAVSAVRQACAHDRDGSLGASLHLARLLGARPSTMPIPFVRELFDAYADRFDDHLVAGLGYTGPALIAEALRRAGLSDLGIVLDLGCGTGLMARAIAERAEVVDGVDLAPRMIRHAQETGLYRRLATGELAAFLEAQRAGSYDTVLAADVLVYIGELAPAMIEVARVLVRGGAFAFTVQRGTGSGYTLGADMRFHHGADEVTRALSAAGLSPVLVDPASTRHDRGVPVPGLVVVARRP